MSRNRLSGIVLHPTSLPGRYGIGDLGPAAYDFLDFLAASGGRMWQVMPLGPTGYGDSPYQCFSAFAGNPMLLSPDLLREEGFLGTEDIETVPDFPSALVEYAEVIPWKSALLEKAYQGFLQGATDWQRRRFEGFCRAPAQTVWLDDYALFRALKDEHGGAEWVKWEPGLRARDPEALAAAQVRLADPVQQRKFYQWCFAEQWASLRRHAAGAGVKVLGDVPIFVAHDSADSWAAPEQFQFDEEGRPLVVAGVPPDYFSPTGQLWGNPLYRWETMQEDGFTWWIQRLEGAFALYDVVRLDHFRGFQAYWEVPAGEETAMNGQWVVAPGAELFRALREALGEVPIVAEDLGLITPEVEALRMEFGFPGMKILQFAFGDDATNEYLPHNVEPASVIYSGTHDNDTSKGWYDSAAEPDRDRARRYLGSDGEDICWDLIRAALASVSDTALVPMQDLLGIGSEGRMNTPGLSSGNWSWRLGAEEATPELAQRFAELNELYGR